MPSTVRLLVEGPPGSGRKTLVGSLIYKLGNSMQLMEQLQRAGITQRADIPGWMQKHNIPLSIETQRHNVELLFSGDGASEQTQYDGIIRIIDLEGLESITAEDSSPNSDASSQVPVIVVLNKIDKVTYSQELLSKALSSAQASSTSTSATRTTYVAVSALHGTNILDESTDTAWTSAPLRKSFTLVNAIDALM